jgi:hypothetical protein
MVHEPPNQARTAARTLLGGFPQWKPNDQLIFRGIFDWAQITHAKTLLSSSLLFSFPASTILDSPYMDAPSLPSTLFCSGPQEEIAPTL